MQSYFIASYLDFLFSTNAYFINLVNYKRSRIGIVISTSRLWRGVAPI